MCHGKVPVVVCLPLCSKEGTVKKKDQKGIRKIEEESQKLKESYLAGIKRFYDRGVPIIIDGKSIGEEGWSKILEVREDNSFYMADFVESVETGQLREIRFDRVYNK